MVFSLILLRSLRVYILKPLFFSISVNSGFGNNYLAAFSARLIFSLYSPRFQRIIVNCFSSAKSEIVLTTEKLHVVCFRFVLIEAPLCGSGITGRIITCSASWVNLIFLLDYNLPCHRSKRYRQQLSAQVAQSSKFEHHILLR